MGDNTILTPGTAGYKDCALTPESQDTTQYLEKDKYLSEFATEQEKEIARINIGAASEANVYTKQETDSSIKTIVKDSLQQHLNTDDPHGILPQVESQLEDVVKQDGSKPFIAPQRGVDPVADYHLTTKRFVTKLLNEHLSSDDPHQILPEVKEILQQYVKASEVYFKNQVYTTREVDTKLSDYLKKDGSTPFTKPQLGIDPTLDSHLTTKRYVDSSIYDHLVEVDPHGFMTTLNQRLSNYYKKAETYSKAQTYSRTQIDTIIRSLVNEAAKEAIEEHINQFDPHGTLAEVKNEHYVKQDGSTPFVAPQKGIEAVEDDELVLLSQLKAIQNELQTEIETCQPIWKTSGPVQSTVGHVNDETELAKEVTFQEIMDAIFYGHSVEVRSPEYAMMGDTVMVDMYIRGSIVIEYAELFQNGELIGVFYPEQFEDGHHQVESLPITEDTVFEFVTTLKNGVKYTATSTTKVSLYVFVGLLSKWYPGSNVTFQYLQDLVKSDPVNNRMIGFGDNVTEIVQVYNFKTPEDLKHLCVAMPESYKDLTGITTKAQEFGLEAFDVIDAIPFQVPGAPEDVIYKIYIYREALVTLTSEVTYKFN